MSKRTIPKYRKDSRGRAFVEHKSIPRKSRRLYLGRHGTPESIRRYRNFLAKLESSVDGVGLRLVEAQRGDEVDVLILEYLEWAKRNYQRPDGVGSEYDCMLYALRPVGELFGTMAASEFGPRHLVEIRSHLVKTGHVRSGINKQLGRIKRFWRWACERELCPTDLYHRLTCVGGLYTGQENVAEADKKQPADLADVRAVLPFVSPPVAAMLRIQYLCGMRPGEVCLMRAKDLDTSGSVWWYRPQRHKTAWRSFSLLKAIPRAAQPIVAEFLTDDASAYLFRPRRPATSKRYETGSYRHAVDYGFAKARKHGVAVNRFTPNQLRHSILTDVSRLINQQAAQRWAGHEDLATTNVYTSTTQAELAAIASKLDSIWATPPI